MNKILSLLVYLANTIIGAVVALALVMFLFTHNLSITAILTGIGYVALLCL